MMNAVFAIVYLLGYFAPAMPVSPRPDLRCLRSPFHLGTDNIPMTNETRTSVIDMWAFVNPHSHEAVAWLYKTRTKQQYLQTNLRERAALEKALTSVQYERYTKQTPPDEEVSDVVRVTPRALISVANSLAKSSILRRSCFTRELPSRYFSSGST